MLYHINNHFEQILKSNVSFSPRGFGVVFASDGKFYQEIDGHMQQYYDPMLGIVRFAGRQYIRTEATSFIRDGVDYTVYLPSEKVFITRGAMRSDNEFIIIDHQETGLFEPEFSSQMHIVLKPERISRSRDLLGRSLVTRATGEIFEEIDGQLRPYIPNACAMPGHFIRCDIEVHSDVQAPHLMSIFFVPRRTEGSDLWQRHFRQTTDIADGICRFATPVIRNQNVIFFSGEKDFARRVSMLTDTVTRITDAGYRSRTGGTPDGILKIPTVDNVSSIFLNELHFEFEAFGDRFKSSDEVDKAEISQVYGDFCRLNDEIHACEGALANRFRTKDEAWWTMHASFMPDFYEPLPDSVYPEFTLDWKFGTMFMGYHTLGKDLLAAFWNNDMNLFRRNEIRPQRISSCEFFIFLGSGTEGQLTGMAEWWRQENIEQYGFLWNDPSNAIGYIPVADLVTYGLTQSQIKEALTGSQRLVATSLYKP